MPVNGVPSERSTQAGTDATPADALPDPRRPLLESLPHASTRPSSVSASVKFQPAETAAMPDSAVVPSVDTTRTGSWKLAVVPLPTSSPQSMTVPSSIRVTPLSSPISTCTACSSEGLPVRSKTLIGSNDGWFGLSAPSWRLPLSPQA